jgi:hypothetical protein
MARDRRYDLEDLVNRAGTYFNPQTEVLVIVDDSTSIDSQVFNMEEFEGADWVLISDDVPVDETQRDEILENFQSTSHAADALQLDDEAEDEDDEDEDDGPPGLGEEGFEEEE